MFSFASSLCIIVLTGVAFYYQGCSSSKAKTCSIKFGECSVGLKSMDSKVVIDKVTCRGKSYVPSASNSFLNGAKSCADVDSISKDYVKMVKASHFDGKSTSDQQKILRDLTQFAGTVVTASDLDDPNLMAVWICSYNEITALDGKDCPLTFGKAVMNVKQISHHQIEVDSLECANGATYTEVNKEKMTSGAYNCIDLRSSAMAQVAYLKSSHYDASEDKADILNDLSAASGLTVTESDLLNPDLAAAWWCALEIMQGQGKCTSLAFGKCDVEVEASNNKISLKRLKCPDIGYPDVNSDIFNDGQTCADVHAIASKFVARLKASHYDSASSDAKDMFLAEMSAFAGKRVVASDLSKQGMLPVWLCGIRKISSYDGQDCSVGFGSALLTAHQKNHNHLLPGLIYCSSTVRQASVEMMNGAHNCVSFESSSKQFAKHQYNEVYKKSNNQRQILKTMKAIAGTEVTEDVLLGAGGASLWRCYDLLKR